MQVNMNAGMRRIIQNYQNSGGFMTEPTQPTEAEASAAERLTQSGKRALDLFSGARRLIGDEIAFARDEMLDRAQTETHLFNEFLSKMAEAHSVNDIRTMYEVCGQHQIDFIQRDYERLFKRARRSIEATSKFFGNASKP
jgi:hypothetical protein